MVLPTTLFCILCSREMLWLNTKNQWGDEALMQNELLSPNLL